MKDSKTPGTIATCAELAIQVLILISMWLFLVRVSGWIMGTAFGALVLAFCLSLELHQYRKERKRKTESEQKEEEKS